MEEEAKINHIKEIINTHLGIDDISKKTNKRIYVYGRCIFFNIIRNCLKLSLNEYGKLLNKDHSTVLHAFKMFESYSMNYDFNSNYKSIYSKIPKDYFLNKSKPLTREEKEIKYLYSNKLRLEKQIEMLKTKLIPLDIDDEIKEILSILPIDKRNELINFRIRPFLKLNGGNNRP